MRRVGRRDAAWVGMNRARRELNVGGLLVGKVGMLGEVYDRDAEESEVLRVRRGWARMLGLEAQEKLAQVLTALKLASRMSGEEAARLNAVLDKLSAGQRGVYRRFLGTLLASGSDEGTKAVSDPPAEARSLGTVQMPGIGGAAHACFQSHETAWVFAGEHCLSWTEDVCL